MSRTGTKRARPSAWIEQAIGEAVLALQLGEQVAHPRRKRAIPLPVLLPRAPKDVAKPLSLTGLSR